MHVLIIPNAFPTLHIPAGIFVKEQLLSLIHSGCKAGVITIDLKKATSIFSHFKNRINFDSTDGIPVLKFTGINYSPFHYFYHKYAAEKYIFELFKEYKEKFGQPDIIHAHFGLWSGYCAMMLSEKTGIPFVLTEHTTYLAEKKYSAKELFYLKVVYSKASKLIAVSDSLRSKMHYLLHDKKIDVIPNIVDTGKFAFDENSDNYIFSLGNLIEQKGFDTLIKAFAGAFPLKDGPSLVIGGEGYLKPKLIRLAHQLNINEKVFFTGTLTRSQVAERMQSAKAFALTSRFETFGIVFAEALACGLPVLATKCGGPEEYINDSNGVLCEPDNIPEIIEGLKKLNRMKKNIQYREKIIKDFSPATVAEKIRKIYSEII
jgi:L-malate glycosyltransferase